MALHKGNLLYCEATISQIEEKWTGSQVKLDFLAWTDTNWRTSPSNRLVEGGIFVVSIASSMSKLLMFDASQSRPWIYWAQIPHTEFLIRWTTGLHATKIRYRIPTGLDDKWWLLRGDYNLIYWLRDKKMKHQCHPHEKTLLGSKYLWIASGSSFKIACSPR